MKPTHLLVALATIFAASVAATAVPAAAGTPSSPTATGTGGMLHVGFAVQGFVKRGHSLLAIGQTISTVTSDQGTYTTVKPFVDKVSEAAAKSVGGRSTQ